VLRLTLFDIFDLSAFYSSKTIFSFTIFCILEKENGLYGSAKLKLFASISAPSQSPEPLTASIKPTQSKTDGQIY